MNALEYEEALKELECPVCANHMLAPIFECSRGHSICNDCFPTVNECPTCRAPKSDSRNYTLENMVEKLKIPCKYTERGCTFKARGCDIGKHADYCDFGDIQCIRNECQKWIGQRQHLLKHHMEQHQDNLKKTFEFVDVVNFTGPNARNNSYFILLVNAYNKVFMLYWKKANKTGYIPWCVYYLGVPEEACKYAFKIKIEHSKLSDNSIEIKSTCQSLKNKHSEDDLRKNCLHILNYDQLTSYCDDGGALLYEVKIIKLDDKKNQES